MSRSRPPAPKWQQEPLSAAADDDDDAAALDPPVDDDALLASIAGFLAPDPFVASKSSQAWAPTQEVAADEDNDDDDAAGDEDGSEQPESSSPSKMATRSSGPAPPPTKLKRSRKRKDTEASLHLGETAKSEAELAAAQKIDRDAAAIRLAQHKSKQKRRRVVTTERLSHIAGTGLVHSSLPLLSALVRERILEHALPAAASALHELYPAYRLDMDCIFKCSVQLLEQHARSTTAAVGTAAETAAHNQLTRFYRKIINLQPKNMVQVVFELAFQFLAHGQCQEAYDHLSTWAASPYLAARANAARSASGTQDDSGGPMQLLQGYLGVVSWECSKQARDEAARWTEAIHRREDGDDEDEYSGGARDHHVRGRQSLSDLRLELRTCQAKQSSFEKLARNKLRVMIKTDPRNAVWLWHYLECMHAFYEHTRQQQLAHSSAASSSAAKASVHLDDAKLMQLQQRLLRKIDFFIHQHSSMSAGADSSGFHMRLHYMRLFQPSGPRGSAERGQWWLIARHLLARDLASNLAIAHAWHLWVLQGQRGRHEDDEGAVRTGQLIDALAARLDLYPSEEWSWHAMARVLVVALGQQEKYAALLRWPIADPLEADEARTSAKPAAPAASAAPSRAVAAAHDSDSDSERQSHDSSFVHERARRKAEAAAAAVAAAASPPPEADAYEDNDDESAASHRGGAHAVPPSPASQVSGSTGGASGSTSALVHFRHLDLDSLASVSERERHDAWLGRIEWWVQSPEHWRDVEHVLPADVPRAMPDPHAQRMLLLRGICNGLVLRWMGWLQ